MSDIDTKYKEWISEYISRTPIIYSRCKEACEEMRKEFPELVQKRGIAWTDWGERQHFWCTTPDGHVVDPTVSQYPFSLVYRYEEFDPDPDNAHRELPSGVCPDCGKYVYRSRAVYTDFCSEKCAESYAEYVYGGVR